MPFLAFLLPRLKKDAQLNLFGGAPEKVPLTPKARRREAIALAPRTPKQSLVPRRKSKEGDTRTNRAGNSEVLRGGRWRRSNKPQSAPPPLAIIQDEPQAAESTAVEVPSQPKMPGQMSREQYRDALYLARDKAVKKMALELLPGESVLDGAIAYRVQRTTSRGPTLEKLDKERRPTGEKVSGKNVNRKMFVVLTPELLELAGSYEDHVVAALKAGRDVPAAAIADAEHVLVAEHHDNLETISSWYATALTKEMREQIGASRVSRTELLERVEVFHLEDLLLDNIGDYGRQVVFELRRKNKKIESQLAVLAAVSVPAKSQKAKITPEQFESASNGSIQAHNVTEQMLSLSASIPSAEAARLARLPGAAWAGEPIIEQIETAIPGVRDRQIQAILETASRHGSA